METNLRELRREEGRSCAAQRRHSVLGLSELPEMENDDADARGDVVELTDVQAVGSAKRS